MRRVLIIGTSHSQATCAYDAVNNGTPIVYRDGRWHDYFKVDYGWETISLSQSAVSPQQQLETLSTFIKDNPDERFDLVIIEGRSMESNASYPDVNASWTDWTKGGMNAWQFVKENPEKMGDPPYHTKRKNAGQILEDHATKFYANWFSDYLLSYQHALDTFAINRAMASLASDISDHVRFMALGSTTAFPPDHPVYDMMEQFMGQYKFKTFKGMQFPALDNGVLFNYNEEKYKCQCHHMNKLGHVTFWNTLVKPEVEDIFGK